MGTALDKQKHLDLAKALPNLDAIKTHRLSCSLEKILIAARRIDGFAFELLPEGCYKGSRTNNVDSMCKRARHQQM